MATGRHLSLEQIERRRAPAPTFRSSLVLTCHRLRAKPIGDFTTEDLRVMIGQQIGLRHLAPIAIEALEADPLAAGDFYPGDLLRNLVLKGEPEFRANKTMARRVADICRRAVDIIEADPACLQPSLRAELLDEFSAFRARWDAA